MIPFFILGTDISNNAAGAYARLRPTSTFGRLNKYVRSYVTFARVLGTLSVYPIIITISFRQLSCAAQLFGVLAVILCRPHVSYGVTRRLYKRLKRNATVSCLSRRRRRSRSRSRRRITVETSTRKFNSNGRHWDGGCCAKVKKKKNIGRLYVTKIR